MHFVVHCLDHENALPLRLATLEAHRAYLKTLKVKLVVAGPLAADDNETMIGSCFIVEADNKQDVIDFNKADPYMKAGLWRDVKINNFLKRTDNR